MRRDRYNDFALEFPQERRHPSFRHTKANSFSAELVFSMRARRKNRESEPMKVSCLIIARLLVAAGILVINEYASRASEAGVPKTGDQTFSSDLENSKVRE